MCGQHEIDSVIVFSCMSAWHIFFSLFSLSLYLFLALSFPLRCTLLSTSFLSFVLLSPPLPFLSFSLFPSCIHHPPPSTLLFLFSTTTTTHNKTDSSLQQRHSSFLPIYPPWATRFQKSPAQRQIATRPSWTPNQQHQQQPPLILIPTTLIPMANNNTATVATAVTV